MTDYYKPPTAGLSGAKVRDNLPQPVVCVCSTLVSSEYSTNNYAVGGESFETRLSRIRRQNWYLRSFRDRDFRAYY